jgi:hypothetical protein
MHERRDYTETGEGIYDMPYRASVVGAHAVLFGAETNGRELTEVFALEAASCTSTRPPWRSSTASSTTQSRS